MIQLQCKLTLLVLTPLYIHDLYKPLFITHNKKLTQLILQESALMYY